MISASLRSAKENKNNTLMNICIVSNGTSFQAFTIKKLQKHHKWNDKTTLVTCGVQQVCQAWLRGVCVYACVGHMEREKSAQLLRQEKLKWLETAVIICVCVRKNVRQGERERRKESVHLCVVWSWLRLQLSTSVLWYNPPGRHSCTDTWRGSFRGAGGNGVVSYQSWNWHVKRSLNHIDVETNKLKRHGFHPNLEQILTQFPANQHKKI